MTEQERMGPDSSGKEAPHASPGDTAEDATSDGSRRKHAAFEGVESNIAQVQQMRKLATDIRTAISGLERDIPAGVTEQLTRLTTSLARAEHLATVQEHERSQLHSLAGVGQLINSSLDLTTVLNEVMDSIISLTGAERGFLMLRDEVGELEFRTARNLERETLDDTDFEISRTVVTRVAASGEAILTTNAQEDPTFSSQASVVLYNLLSILCVPLQIKSNVIGVIYADNRIRTGAFSERDLGVLTTFADQAAVAIDNARLFEDEQSSRVELAQAYDSTLKGWALALELRDHETSGHSQRVMNMTLQLARTLGVDDDFLDHMRRGALLHDIGKMGIPDALLLKPGPLDNDEWEIMRRHPQYAYDMLQTIEYLHPALDIPLYHHEKWDGSGYLKGRSGEAIPLAARIFAVADVWDALRSDRPYREAWAVVKVQEYIETQSGAHFDPQVVEALRKLPQAG